MKANKISAKLSAIKDSLGLEDASTLGAIDKLTKKTINEAKGNAVLPLVIGGVYGQTITGTMFKQKVLKYQGKFNNNDYYLVENVETGYEHTMIGDDLHCMNAKEFYEFQLNDKTSVVGRQDKDEIIMLMEEYYRYKVKTCNKPAVIGQSEQLLHKHCKICNAEIRNDLGDALCAECWLGQ